MKLNFKKLGEGSQTLVVLHGFLGTLDNWITLGRRWAEDFTVYLVDLRNHGFSPHSDEFNYDVMTEDVLELFNDEKIKSPLLLGHSMGGKLAMNLALNYPARIEGLIVVDIAPRALDVRHDGIVDALCSLPIETIETRQQADDHLAKSITHPGVRQFLLKNLNRTPEGFRWKMNLPVLQREIEQIGRAIGNGKKFEKPALFIGGENSDYILQSDEADIKSKFPRAKITHVPNAGHWVHSEAPDEVYDLVKTFADLIS